MERLLKVIPLKIFNQQVSYVFFTLIIALYFALVINLPIYKDLASIFDQSESVKIGFIISIPIFFFAVFNFLFSFFSLPWLSKPFFILLLMLSTIVCYAGYNYGAIFDEDMIVNIVQTDHSEASSYFSIPAFIWVILMGVVPAIWIARVSFKKTAPLRFILVKLGSMLASVLVIIGVAFFYYQDYASVGRNNSHLRQLIIPTYFIDSAIGYVNTEYFSHPIPYQHIGLDAKQSPKALLQAKEKPTLMILVIGETARSQNYESNGYPRPTNAFTRDLNMISYHDVQACGTSTAISLPCMFSKLRHSNFDRAKANNQDNLLDILKRAEIGILWKENDGGDKAVARNVELFEVDRRRKDEMCNGRTCYDMALLENFDQNVTDLEGKRIIALHLIGSHGPTYFQRYPKEMAHFQPDCPTAAIENCSIEQIVNGYDNTIRYTDYVIAQTIAKLETLKDQFNTGLIYVSDHGESLGENGVFLHGLPYMLAPDYQKKVPLMVWFSPELQSAKNVDMDCLKGNERKMGVYSHDNFFHSILGIMDISTIEYEPQLDIFASCRNKTI